MTAASAVEDSGDLLDRIELAARRYWTADKERDHAKAALACLLETADCHPEIALDEILDASELTITGWQAFQVNLATPWRSRYPRE